MLRAPMAPRLRRAVLAAVILVVLPVTGFFSLSYFSDSAIPAPPDEAAGYGPPAEGAFDQPAMPEVFDRNQFPPATGWSDRTGLPGRGDRRVLDDRVLQEDDRIGSPEADVPVDEACPDGDDPYYGPDLVAPEAQDARPTPFASPTPEPTPTPEPFQADDTRVYVSANVLNLRKAPSTDGAILEKLSFGDRLTRIAIGAGWSQVRTADGKTGYVVSEYLSTTMVFKDDSTRVYVISNSLNLRKGPSTEYAILKKLGYGDRLTRTGIGDGWSRVKTSSGTVGYVANEFISTKAPADRTTTPVKPLSDSAIDLGKAIAKEALKYLGVPYRSAADPDVGFDCSGLTWYVFGRYKISVPRSARDYSGAGVRVPLSEAVAGDILCWDTRRDGRTSCTHVGIYLGDGRMVHASSTLGEVVIVEISRYNAQLLYVKRFI